MKYVIKNTTQFKKDLKLMQKQGKNLSLLSDVIKQLADDKTLEDKYKDHALSGSFAGCRECHITPDWLLIYEKSETELILYLTRTGSHSNLFQK